MLTPVIAAALLATPNIIVIHVDDLGWQDIAVPMHTQATPLNNQWRTPNIQRLATQGAVLTNGYAAAPVCTPSRVSLMTGQTPARHGTTYWTLHKDTDTSRNHPNISPPAWKLNGLQPGTPTLPALLQQQGYRTIHAGKAHFGAHDTPGGDPTTLGFDVNIAGHASGGPASYLGEHDFSVAGRKGSGGPTVWDIPGLEEYHGQNIFLTEALSQRACREIDRAVADDTPFYLQFAPYAVHAPIMANKRLLKHYDDLHPIEARYATMIESVDNAVGDLLGRLDAHGIADNTIVVFVSDNGGLSAHARGGMKNTHNAPLRSGKGSAYEGGTRVPWIIRWPGVATPGDRIDTPVVTNDLSPTLLHAAGAGASFPKEHHVDGRDLQPALAGHPLPDRTIGWHQPHQWGAPGPGIEPFTAIRHGRWKLICFHDGPRFELYDMATDLSETHNLLDTHPEVAQTMLDRLHTWIRQTGADLSVDRTTGAPIIIPRAVPITHTSTTIAPPS